MQYQLPWANFMLKDTLSTRTEDAIPKTLNFSPWTLYQNIKLVFKGLHRAYVAMNNYAKNSISCSAVSPLCRGPCLERDGGTADLPLHHKMGIDMSGWRERWSFNLHLCLFWASSIPHGLNFVNLQRAGSIFKEDEESSARFIVNCNL